MKHFTPTFPAEFWIVANLSELQHGFVCETIQDVHDAIDCIEGKRGQKWRVLKVGDDELGRDVTADFLPDEDEPDFDAYAAADRLHQEHMEGVRP